MAKRSNKTAAQQCRYYEVDNIFEYMVETYINGNISVFRELYHELNNAPQPVTVQVADFGLWFP